MLKGQASVCSLSYIYIILKISFEFSALFLFFLLHHFISFRTLTQFSEVVIDTKFLLSSLQCNWLTPKYFKFLEQFEDLFILTSSLESFKSYAACSSYCLLISYYSNSFPLVYFLALTYSHLAIYLSQKLDIAWNYSPC